jgi:Protein of unknown function (DUF4242)
MTRPLHDDDVPRAFLVERYLSPAAAVDLAAATSRVARLCGDAGVRYLYSAYLPTEDTCFCLFRAPSADAVRAVNHHGQFAFDRLIDAVLMRGDPRDLQ